MIVLVHSPLVGPQTWEAVADILRSQGHEAICPDLTGSLVDGPPYWSHQVEAIAQGASRPVVLVGHSGAGPLLPAAGQAIGDVEGYVFVDAGLPHPGRNWFETAPAEVGEQLRSMVHNGWLAPWSEWWPAETLAGLLPDSQVRTRFVAGCRPLPVALFEEATPMVSSWPDAPCAYLRLSEAYAVAVTEARRLGWPVIELAKHHLSMLTDPQPVAVALEDLLMKLRREHSRSS